MDISNISIGGRIRKIREERGYTREQLAEYADISSDFLWQVEAGRKSMKVQNIAKIAAALDVPTDYLIYGSSPYKDNPKINNMISALPDGLQKQVEKMITLFVDSLRKGIQINSESDKSEKE